MHFSFSKLDETQPSEYNYETKVCKEKQMTGKAGFFLFVLLQEMCIVQALLCLRTV